MSDDVQAHPCPHWCRASNKDEAHRWGGSPEEFTRQRFGQVSVVQTERLSPAGTGTVLNDAELIHPDPLDADDADLPRAILRQPSSGAMPADWSAGTRLTRASTKADAAPDAVCSQEHRPKTCRRSSAVHRTR
jgi:hypothetical protein